MDEKHVSRPHNEPSHKTAMGMRSRGLHKGYVRQMEMSR